MSFLSKFFGSKRPDRKRSIDSPQPPPKAYPAVELIVSASGACAAAQARSGKRLLSIEAQPLPVTECDQLRCRCRYRKFPDRRTEARRLSDLALLTTSDVSLHTGRGQRKGNGRRRTDASTK